MNHIFRNNLFFAWAMILMLPMSSCDDIDEADRIDIGQTTSKEITTQIITVEEEGETFEFPQEQRLLIEDFTGWKCVNCPDIADFLSRKIIPIYPSVMVSMHMVSNRFSQNHPNKYNCASADSICDLIQGSSIASSISLPSVCINRSSFGTSKFASDTVTLANKALELYTQGLKSDIADVAVNVSKREEYIYDISTYINYKGQTNCHLQLWLIEEELKSVTQQSHSGWIKDYLNHGILRLVINGYSGQNILLSEGKTVAHHTLNIQGTEYIPKNCRIVAIVLQPDGVSVANCYETKIEN